MENRDKLTNRKSSGNYKKSGKEKLYSTFYIADESFYILHDINLNIEQGEFVGIMGKSGSGKFALINIIGFLDDQFEERYDFYEHTIHDYMRAQFSKCGRIKLWEII